MSIGIMVKSEQEWIQSKFSLVPSFSDENCQKFMFPKNEFIWLIIKYLCVEKNFIRLQKYDFLHEILKNSSFKLINNYHIQRNLS